MNTLVKVLGGIVLGAAAMFALIALAILNASAPPPTIDVPPSVQPSEGWSEGVYLVGRDISPGELFTAGTPDHLCYWARWRDATSNPGGVIANKQAEGPMTVLVHPTDVAVELDGPCHWTIVHH